MSTGEETALVESAVPLLPVEQESSSETDSSGEVIGEGLGSDGEKT